MPGTRNEPGTPTITVQFKDVSEEMIRDRIVVGIQNKSIQRRLLREREREIERVVTKISSGHVEGH